MKKLLLVRSLNFEGKNHNANIARIILAIKDFQNLYFYVFFSQTDFLPFLEARAELLTKIVKT